MKVIKSINKYITEKKDYFSYTDRHGDGVSDIPPVPVQLPGHRGPSAQSRGGRAVPEQE